MATIFDVNITKLIEKAAEVLKDKKEFEIPSWTKFVKTGTHKERPPQRDDWWYVRTASVLHKIYRHGPIGVSKLRTKYGGNKRRGHAPARFYKGSGSIIRKILQQLDKAGYTKYAEKGVHKGRIITPKGKSFLDKLVKEVK